MLVEKVLEENPQTIHTYFFTATINSHTFTLFAMLLFINPFLSSQTLTIS